ncbi:MAG TPA: heparin lyase I family protein [Polyangia bacterium]|nr:heparin lyase I family protein [Polyangia bacterium]
MRTAVLGCLALVAACSGGGPARAPDAADDNGAIDEAPRDAATPADLPTVDGQLRPAGDDGPVPSADAQSAPDAAPARLTACVNADGVGGQDTYALFQSALGSDALDVYADDQHKPPVRHIREDTDDVVGPHFVVVIHRDIDLDHLKNDRQRVEITIHPLGTERLKGHDGSTIVYTWRFKLAPDLKTSSAFGIFFQLKSEGGNASAPIVALTAHGNDLEIHQVGNDGVSHTLAGTAFSPLRGLWLEAYARATFSHQGAFFMTVKKPDGTVVLKADAPRADMWRDGDFTKPKWGIYRSLNDKGALNPGEDSVRFANFAITPGAAPDSDCR